MNEKLKELYNDLPAEAIQRTNGQETGKKYDTTGYSYQYTVDRLNDVCGSDWGYSWHIINEQKGTFKTGMPFFDITVQVEIWIEKKENVRSLVGSHISKTYGDALKGAITNGFKKTAAMWGVGAKAYRGEIDDDNRPQGGEVHSYNDSKTDFEIIKQELSEINDIEILREYHSELMQKCKSDKQKYSINNFVGERKKEIEASNKLKDEFQGKLVD